MAKYNNIKAELVRKDLTTASLAEYMGMSAQTVRNKINGKCGVFFRDMYAIQNFFNEEHGERLSLEYLFEDFETESRQH